MVLRCDEHFHIPKKEKRGRRKYLEWRARSPERMLWLRKEGSEQELRVDLGPTQDFCQPYSSRNGLEPKGLRTHLIYSCFRFRKTGRNSEVKIDRSGYREPPQTNIIAVYGVHVPDGGRKDGKSI